MPALLLGPFGKLIGGAAILGLIILSLWLYGNSRYNDGKQDTELTYVKQNAEAALAYEQNIRKIETGWWSKYTSAQQNFADRQTQQDPIIVRSTEKVIQYAQTDAGRVNCLAPDRVQGILLDRAALFTPSAPAATSGGTPVVPANGAINQP